ncbi:hypothetical protein NEFER03_0078 [Nematocida sp. LUAm3]|nr:hypothetical protein NEFER03_0078 [Nematocida sp. LUAm3]KAI5173531.1 hypothetical protein NEFER02_0047 [Nematocida sp. LUAm2]KAI5176752.1 hypothetical protein NEFER01_0077 [Nematocida sp. LUAm1]
MSRAKQHRTRYSKYTVHGVLCIITVFIAIYVSNRIIRRESISEEQLEYIVSFPSQSEWSDRIDVRPAIAAFGRYNVSDEEILNRYRRVYVIVQAWKGKDLVSNVFVIATYYRSSDSLDEERYPVFEIYNVYVNSKYSGNMQCIKHMYTALKYLQKVYGVGADMYIGLHMSPRDKAMGKVFAIYRTNGFVRGDFSFFGPNSYHRNYEKIKELPEIDRVVEVYLKTKGNIFGKENSTPIYLTTFTTLQEFYSAVEKPVYDREKYEEYKKKGVALQDMLLERYQYT